MVKKWSDFYNNEIAVKDILGNYYNVELFEEIIKRKSKEVLEIGSGRGVISIFLSLLGYNVTSIDNDKKLVEKCKKTNKRFNTNVKFEVRDALNLKFKKKFDLVFSEGFFEHFSDGEIKKLLDEQLRVAKKYVLVSVPNKNYPSRDFGDERLLKDIRWFNLFKKLSLRWHVKLSYLNYQFALRRDKPIKTIMNLILNKKVHTLIIIEKVKK